LFARVPVLALGFFVSVKEEEVVEVVVIVFVV